MAVNSHIVDKSRRHRITYPPSRDRPRDDREPLRSNQSAQIGIAAANSELGNGGGQRHDHG